MPSSNEILARLAAAANQESAIAILWHLAIAGALLGLAAGWRPSVRTALALLAAPLGSAGLLALAYDNPFNGIVLVAAAAAAVAAASTARPHLVRRAPAWLFAIGVASLAFGWVYPHFLTGSPLRYLYAAPVGVVPCPTLAVVIGFTLMGGGLGHRAWMFGLAGLGLFYGVFGAFRLGVWLDAGLIAGAAVLLAAAVGLRRGHPVAAGAPA